MLRNGRVTRARTANRPINSLSPSASLPPAGVLYLQYGDETKHIRMPNEITSIDTVRALFVSAFPQQLTMKMLESPSVAVYVKDDMRNVYYELSDVRSGLFSPSFFFFCHLKKFLFFFLNVNAPMMGNCSS